MQGITRFRAVKVQLLVIVCVVHLPKLPGLGDTLCRRASALILSAMLSNSCRTAPPACLDSPKTRDTCGIVARRSYIAILVIKEFTMSKKQATKVVNEYEADVKTAAQMMHNLIDTIYPKSDELKYARERMAENLVWRADRDAEYQATKVEEAKAKLDDAIYVERAIQEKQEREAINEPNTTVYDTRRENAERWYDRMEMQMHGASMFRDAAILCRDTLSD